MFIYRYSSFRNKRYIFTSHHQRWHQTSETMSHPRKTVFFLSDPPNASFLASSIVSHTSALPQAYYRAFCKQIQLQVNNNWLILLQNICKKVSTIEMTTRKEMSPQSFTVWNTLINGGLYRMTSITSFVFPPICRNCSLVGLTWMKSRARKVSRSARCKTMVYGYRFTVHVKMKDLKKYMKK